MVPIIMGVVTSFLIYVTSLILTKGVLTEYTLLAAISIVGGIVIGAALYILREIKNK